jgi:hypothetical protein
VQLPSDVLADNHAENSPPSFKDACIYNPDSASTGTRQSTMLEVICSEHAQIE